eukprot:365457-Chlamydomonas_euryale.AAC.4
MEQTKCGQCADAFVTLFPSPLPRFHTHSPACTHACSAGYRRMSLLVLYFNPSDLLCPDPSWEAISDRLICAPVVETLVFSKFKPSVRRWVDSIVSDWAFTRVIPAHFAAPVKAGPADFKAAFAFAYEDAEDADGAENVATPAAQGGVAGLFGRLFGGTGKATAAGAVPRRVVEFPEKDIATLRNLNSLLLKTGLVKSVDK